MGRVMVRAEVVQKHLLRRNISQNGLALKAGVSQGYLSQLLHGIRFPGPKVRSRLMRALQIRQFDELFEVVAAEKGERG